MTVQLASTVNGTAVQCTAFESKELPTKEQRRELEIDMVPGTTVVATCDHDVAARCSIHLPSGLF